MSKTKKIPTEPANKENRFLLEPVNYYIMIGGLVLIALGFILMAGGRSDDPNYFNPEIYNFRRIRLAPILVILGLVTQVVAILYKKK